MWAEKSVLSLGGMPALFTKTHAGAASARTHGSCKSLLTCDFWPRNREKHTSRSSSDDHRPGAQEVGQGWGGGQSFPRENPALSFSEVKKCGL